MAKKKTPGLNTQSTADIAFLLLCYFLMVSTMDQQSGLKVNRRNIIIVKINSSDRLFAGDQLMDVSQLKDKIKEFMTNPNEDPNLPEKEVKNIEGFGDYPVTKGVISLQNDRGTSYKAYIAVQNELVKAINEIRDDFCRQNFGRVYNACSEDQQKIAREAIPQNISEAEPKDVTKK